MMRRRTFVTGAAATLAAVPRFAWAQETRRIAIVEANAPVTVIDKGAHIYYGPLLEELERLGWVEGRNLTIDRYSGGGKPEQFPELAARIVKNSPDLIYTRGTTALVRALRESTNSIPIVTVTVSFVELGFAQSLAHPGGNITGMSVNAGDALFGKRMQFIHDTVPKFDRVAILHIRERWDDPGPAVISIREAAIQFGATVVPALLDAPVTEETYERIFAALAGEGIDALFVVNATVNQDFTQTIVRLANEARVPASYPFRNYVLAGGLMSYGPNVPDLFVRAAGYVDKILKGANPADLPIERPAKFDFAINLKTARELGITFPPEIMIRATEIIE